MNIDIQKVVEELPDNLQAIVHPDNPVEKRLLAASGAIPLVPRNLAIVLFILTFDENAEIKTAAMSSLKDIPQEIMIDMLNDKETNPDFLDYMVRNMGNEKYNQAVALNSSAKDSTYEYLARNEHSQTNIDIIANNKKRILRSEKIVEALSNNPSVSRSTLDEVLSFLNLQLNREYSGSYKAERSEQSDDVESGQLSDEKTEAGDVSDEEYTESFFDRHDIDNEFIEETEEEATDIIQDSVYSRIQMLNMAERLKIALQGNMEARRILIRDNNKMISNAVLKNPRLTDMEIVLFSQSKVVDDEILRRISENRKWMRLYQVKSSLVNNPKTPVHISMNLLRHIREFDLRKIMVDRNLPGTITTAARNILKEKK